MKRFSKLFLLTLCISACGLMAPVPLKLYEGIDKPLSDVASISEGIRWGSRIIGIDDKLIIDPSIGAARHTKGILVSPGDHVVHWKFERFAEDQPYGAVSIETATGHVNYYFKAGHSYVPIFKVNKNKESVYFEILDKGKNYNQECLTSKHLSGREVVKGC